MKYIVTLITTDGLTMEETLDLPVEPTISWSDFVSLSAVRELTLLNPHMTVCDVSPWDMPASFTDEQMKTIQLSNMGLRRNQVEGYAPKYVDLD